MKQGRRPWVVLPPVRPAIAWLYFRGRMTQKELAWAFQMSQPTVHRIISTTDFTAGTKGEQNAT